ncbi:MAG TPA: hypothetical protein IGS52_05835 [Oscillatoriaceae cyanobacterium M33_DOE_052]|uniref:Uncharacterized protein n=1 Tax=Planktothricoides sp. SpSt-374 TaxID=2282167 RepID=A0A7C3VMW7_9CYAN|nr:hypothetical protein [Oscillatoriaceae cyanobacterium M33_DOE_052]
MSSYQEVRRQVETLNPEEQLQLLEELAAMVRRRVRAEPLHPTGELPAPNLDKWFGFLPKRVDALEFQQEIRREWDD